MPRGRTMSESSRGSMTADEIHSERAPLLKRGRRMSFTSSSVTHESINIEHAAMKKEVEKVPIVCSFRLGVSLCCMISMMINFATQASMTSSLVCMLEKEEEGGNATLSRDFGDNMTSSNTTTEDKDGWKFNWDKSTQGIILSSFFIGYYLSQLPSGLLSARFGPKKVLVCGLLLESVFQVLTVPAAKMSIGWLCADRVIAGLIAGLLYAPTFALVGQWTPRFETSLLFGIAGMGMEMGNMLSFAISMGACEVDFQGGWPLIFYIMGGMGVVTALIVLIFVSDSPFNNRFISERELDYIADYIPQLDRKDNRSLASIPMKSILTSMPVWAIVVSQIGSDWLYYMLVAVAPMYLQDVIKLTNFQVNLLAGMPFLGIIPSIYLAGHFADKLVSKGIVTNTTVRKVSDTVCKLVPAGVLLGLCFLPVGAVVSAFCLNTVGAVALGFSYVSWMANPVDLAPAYTGSIVGVCEVGAVWVAIVVPILFDEITKNKQREEWQLAFYITVGLQVVTNIFYWIFASGEMQSWAGNTFKYEYQHVPGEDTQKKKKDGRLSPLPSGSSLESMDTETTGATEKDKLLSDLSGKFGNHSPKYGIAPVPQQNGVRVRVDPNEGYVRKESKVRHRTVSTSGRENKSAFESEHGSTRKLSETSGTASLLNEVSLPTNLNVCITLGDNINVESSKDSNRTGLDGVRYGHGDFHQHILSSSSGSSPSECDVQNGSKNELAGERSELDLEVAEISVDTQTIITNDIGSHVEGKVPDIHITENDDMVIIEDTEHIAEQPYLFPKRHQKKQKQKEKREKKRNGKKQSDTNMETFDNVNSAIAIVVDRHGRSVHDKSLLLPLNDSRCLPGYNNNTSSSSIMIPTDEVTSPTSPTTTKTLRGETNSYDLLMRLDMMDKDNRRFQSEGNTRHQSKLDRVKRLFTFNFMRSSSTPDLRKASSHNEPNQSLLKPYVDTDWNSKSYESLRTNYGPNDQCSISKKALSSQNRVPN